jgi:hemerythrin-like domain-containing protein
MKATEILSQEHRVIEQVLACLEKMADRCDAGEPLDGASAERALDFFRRFADECHHGKEEGAFFPLLEARGFPPHLGPTGVMRAEHDLGRRLLRGMAAVLDGAAAGAPAARERFAAYARHYTALLREHIGKEDARLFPMADQALSAGDQAALQAMFAAREHKEMGDGTHAHYLRLADELADYWGVPRAFPEAAVPACGCGRAG